MHMVWVEAWVWTCNASARSDFGPRRASAIVGGATVPERVVFVFPVRDVILHVIYDVRSMQNQTRRHSKGKLEGKPKRIL